MKKQKTITQLSHMAVAVTMVTGVGGAWATNGMLMEGYGSTSAAMGGAAQAHDVGNSGMAQNPATLAMMPDGTSRIAISLGLLQPDVNSTAKTPMGNMSADSSGDRYLMPAIGYVKRHGAWTYGVGMYAQGGMGTEYGGNTFMGMGTGLPSRSELGVGNVMVPVAYQVNPSLVIGGALKFVWASLDMQMNDTLAHMGANYMRPTGSPLEQGFGQVMQNPQAGTTDVARIDFSDSGKYTGAAKGHGLGATLGMTFKVNPALTLGASYQFKTAISDLQTSAKAVALGLYRVSNTGATNLMTDYGKITVLDFQMPAVLAVGGAWQVNPAILLAADLKRIGWASSMSEFKMRYDSGTPGMGSANFAIQQSWKDQTVVNLGVAWVMNDKLTLRAGLNLADNPVPDTYVNPMFPAIETNHITFGFGYHLSKQSNINVSFVHAPTVTVTSPAQAATGTPPIEISHSQNNLQFGYNYSF